ncbi:hypothetical protein BH24ACT5_BH24ACT5_27190 [soil metagenome]
MATFQLTQKDDELRVVLNGRRASRSGVRGPVACWTALTSPATPTRTRLTHRRPDSCRKGVDVRNRRLDVRSMNVHACTVDDLAGLDEVMPLGDGAHRQRLDHQKSGASTYLIATSHRPVGVCIVGWVGPFDASVAKRWPDC